MVYDDIKNSKLYYGMSEGISEGLKYLESTDFSNMEDGRHDIDGDRLFVLLQSYMTKDILDAKAEAHKNYIDIQYVISGDEIMGVAPLENMESVAEEYGEKDLYFYNGIFASIPFPEKSFMILFPHDAHAPGISAGTSGKVRKACLKVRL